MAARAIWKGVIELGEERVPVKLYSAVEDRGIHFRLLHEPDRVPLRRVMVNPRTDEAVPYDQARRGYETDAGRIVVLDDEDLEDLEPEPSRTIEITRFVDPPEIDHRWYDRPYYLGPDGDREAYFALAGALAREGTEGVARWVMRKKEYVGALRLEDGYPMLITLRYAGEVVSVRELDASAPGSGEDAPPGDKELEMARQLIAALEDDFDPAAYEDEYRQRVLELIEAKSRGQTVELREVRRRKEDEEVSLEEALQASLEAAGERKKTA